MSGRVPYPRTFRRALLDMHIPGWHPEFLSEYEPRRLADLYAAGGITGALFYCKSHMGLNYWPAPVGGIHPAAKDRDLVGELLDCLRARDISPAAYHSVIFDCWAVENHPDWAIVPPASRAASSRYGTACPNNTDYRTYEHAQITDLVRRYDIDALWIDMAFWPAICVCAACQQRYSVRTGNRIPKTIDWTSPAWARFQQAREEWIEEFYTSIVDTVRRIRPGLPITHNLAPALHGWYMAQKTAHARHDTFAAGDLYGGRDEQLVVSKLMLNLTNERPPEFMTSRTLDLRSHVSTKSEHEMRTQALAAVAHGSAFLFIDAIEPRGTVNDDIYARIGRVFSEVATYESYLGGEPIADAALYYSDESRVDPLDNGCVIADAVDGHNLPHLTALTGAARLLQRFHIPFAIITRKQLDDLDRYRVILLPDLIRMSRDETAAFTAYARRGGRIYASGRTSLLDTEGNRREDFELADLFGCHLDTLESGPGIFLRATDELVKQALSPERCLSYGFSHTPLGVPRLTNAYEGTPLATLTLPYAYPSEGTLAGHDYASIHSFPPWEDLTVPTIIAHSSGRGRSIYSTAPIETTDTEAGRNLFNSLIRNLLGTAPTLDATAHPNIWITAFDQPAEERIILAALRYENEPPADTAPVTIRYHPPAGRHVVNLQQLPTTEPLHYTTCADGTIELRHNLVDIFDLIQLNYVAPS